MEYNKNERAYTTTSVVQTTMNKVYGWMALALTVSAFAAFYTVSSPALMQLIYGSRFGFWGMLIVEFGLVLYLSARVFKMSFMSAATCFGLYSVVNGVFLSSIFLVYDMPTISVAFISTAATFGVMSVVGYTTKRDLSGIGSFLLMALVGVIIGTLVNMFLRSAMMDYIITYLGLFVFIGLTAYDTQKIKQALAIGAQEGIDTRNIGILGALNLYLDFVNIFLYLLRLFGNRK